MVSVTISVPDSVYAWLAEKASTSNQSVQALIEERVQRMREGDPDDPEFFAALQNSMKENAGLLRRLAE